MFLVAGLGNPGEQYMNTPHNLGFRIVEVLAARHSVRLNRKDSKALAGVGEIAGCPVMLAQPQTYMNLSGTSVAPLVRKHEIPLEQLIVVYDELDLPWGSLRIRPRGSAAGNHGVESLIHHLGTAEFARVRVGIHPGHAVRDGAEFVLAPFKRSQEKELEEVLGRAADAVESIIAEGVEKSMTKFNRRAGGVHNEEA
ncbi:MAG: aminoacyl-tRNA hydrolase [Bryobacteraceae bacterium]